MATAMVVPSPPLPQSDVLYLLAVATMGEGMVAALSNKDTVSCLKKVLYEVWDEVWIRGWSASSNLEMSPRLRALFSAVEYERASNMLRASVIRPLDGLRRSAQEVRPGLFISGKGPAMQPLLCRYLGITHILRCFAIQPKSEPPPTTTSPDQTHREYRSDIWSSAGVDGWDSVRHIHTHTNPVVGGPSHTPVYHHEDELVYSHRGAGRDGGGAYTCRRLTLPAVDDDSYDITTHLLPEVFQFVQARHGMGGGGLLVHCSAGMHRSATIMVGILIRHPMYAATTLDVSPLLEELRSKRPMANPTSVQCQTLTRWARTSVVPTQPSAPYNKLS